jgi:hypothetical protein
MRNSSKFRVYVVPCECASCEDDGMYRMFWPIVLPDRMPATWDTVDALRKTVDGDALIIGSARPLDDAIEAAVVTAVELDIELWT